MKSFLARVAISACFLMQTDVSFAQTAFAPEIFCSKRTLIVFGNGILSTRDNARQAIDQIEKELRTSLPQDEFDLLSLTTSVAYNPTNGLAQDLFEALLQITGTDAEGFWRLLNPGEADLTPEQEQALRDALTQAEVAARETVDAHVNFYKKSLKEGKKVIIVGHSQGNFFANESFNALSSEEQMSVGIVAVASPDSAVAGGGDHTTLFEDLVIELVAEVRVGLGLPAPLAPNVTNGPTDLFSLGHTFTGAYMKGASSRAKIIGDVLDTLDNLIQPIEEEEDGVITVSAGLGSGVRAVFFEPPLSHGGSPVESPAGSSVSVACEDLREGIYAYQMILNGVPDPLPRVVLVIEAGDKVARGVYQFGEGDIHPPDAPDGPAFDIEVTGNQEDGFRFEVL